MGGLIRTARPLLLPEYVPKLCRVVSERCPLLLPINDGEVPPWIGSPKRFHPCPAAEPPMEVPPVACREDCTPEFPAVPREKLLFGETLRLGALKSEWESCCLPRCC